MRELVGTNKVQKQKNRLFKIDFENRLSKERGRDGVMMQTGLSIMKDLRGGEG